MRRPSAPSFEGRRPASERASRSARGASRKEGTECEVTLRRALSRLGLRCRCAARDLVGKPDLVFRRARVAVFCDGDFWHGRNLDARLAKLSTGHNGPYWVAKIRGNVERDARVTRELESRGWTVLRYWETEIRRSSDTIADEIGRVVRRRRAMK